MQKIHKRCVQYMRYAVCSCMLTRSITRVAALCDSPGFVHYTHPGCRVHYTRICMSGAHCIVGEGVAGGPRGEGQYASACWLQTSNWVFNPVQHFPCCEALLRQPDRCQTGFRARIECHRARDWSRTRRVNFPQWSLKCFKMLTEPSLGPNWQIWLRLSIARSAAVWESLIRLAHVFSTSKVAAHVPGLSQLPSAAVFM